jgi:hypothetical protein
MHAQSSKGPSCSLETAIIFGNILCVYEECKILFALFLTVQYSLRSEKSGGDLVQILYLVIHLY